MENEYIYIYIYIYPQDLAYELILSQMNPGRAI